MNHLICVQRIFIALFLLLFGNMIPMNRKLSCTEQLFDTIEQTPACLNSIINIFFKSTTPKIITQITFGDPACAICYEDYVTTQVLYQTSCSHFFCIECLNEWLKKQDICPTCNTTTIKKSLKKVIYKTIDQSTKDK